MEFQMKFEGLPQFMVSQYPILAPTQASARIYITRPRDWRPIMSENHPAAYPLAGDGEGSQVSLEAGVILSEPAPRGLQAPRWRLPVAAGHRRARTRVPLEICARRLHRTFGGWS